MHTVGELANGPGGVAYLSIVCACAWREKELEAVKETGLSVFVVVF